MAGGFGGIYWRLGKAEIANVITERSADRLEKGHFSRLKLLTSGEHPSHGVIYHDPMTNSVACNW
jgi:hypothetical protein